MKVNVGTIGHIDHGKTTLTQTLVKVLGDEMARQVVVVDEAGASDAHRKGLILDVDTYAAAAARPRNNPRKAERKARMKELQRRAFTKEQPQ